MADDLAAKHEQQHDIDSAKAEEIRAESQKLWEARKAASEASQAAWDAGQKDVAKQKSEEAKALKEQAEAADAAAAEKIFNYMNAEGRQPPNTIDLHNLRVAEAERFVNERLEKDSASGAENLIVIYGAGNHSAGGKQALEPAIIELLKGRNIAHKRDWSVNDKKFNDGCVSIYYKGIPADEEGEAAPEPAAA